MQSNHYNKGKSQVRHQPIAVSKSMPVSDDLAANSPLRFYEKMIGTEKFLVDCFCNFNAGFVIFDDQLRYRELNCRLAAMHGISVEAHVGKTLREIIGNVADIVEPAVKQVLATEKPIFNLEVTGSFPTKAGRGRWLVTIFPLDFGDGQSRVGCIVVELLPDARAKPAFREAEPSPNSATQMLRSWKEISNYVGACVKTIQRWEQRYNFPIRRLQRSKGAVVFALTGEVDGWITTRSDPTRSC
jgi:PAS domain-containing protein